MIIRQRNKIRNRNVLKQGALFATTLRSFQWKVSTEHSKMSFLNFVHSWLSEICMQVSFLLQTLLKKAKQTLPDDVKFQVILTFLGQGMRLFYDTCQPTRKEVSFAPQAIPRLVSWQLGPQSILSHTHIAHYIPIFCVWTSVNRKKEQSL